MESIFNYRRRQNLRDQLRRRGRPIFAALALWLCWGLVTILLFVTADTTGLLISLLLLGAVLSAAIAYAALWLGREMRHARQREAGRTMDLVWLNGKLAPRRPLPGWIGGMARIDLLAAALEIIEGKKPARVLELGSGLSTLTIAYGLQANGYGQLVSLEDNPGHAANTRRLLAEHGLTESATVIDAPLQRIELEGEAFDWYALAELPTELPYDILLVDGPAGYLSRGIRYPALPVLQHYLADDAVILVDDTDRPIEGDMVARWRSEIGHLAEEVEHRKAGYTILRRTGKTPVPAS